MAFVDQYYQHRIVSAEKEKAEETERLNLAHRIQKLAEWEEELKRLKELEKKFLDTRDIELLKPFYENFEYPQVKLKEDIQKPVALFEITDFLSVALTLKDLKHIDKKTLLFIEDVKIFDPTIKMRIVESTEGKKMLAFIGNVGDEGRNLFAFHNLKREERKFKHQRELVANHQQQTNGYRR